MNVNVAHELKSVAQEHIARELAAAQSLDEYYARLAPAYMAAGWNRREPSLYPTPRTTFLPAHWSWSTARTALDAAARQCLRHGADYHRSLSDDQGVRGCAQSSPHAERAPLHPGIGARHLHHCRRQETSDGGRRRAAHPELVLARPRQRRRSQRVLDRRPRRPADAPARPRVLRAS